jgi:exodeoxyribonuclease VII large subunit
VTEDLSLDLFDGPEDEPASQGADSPEPPASSAPAVDEPRVWSVSQVNRAVRSLLENSVEPLWIGGEVGQWTRSRAGHCYFSLKDDRAQLRCVMFAREAQQLPTDPVEGMRVRSLGALTLYEARGEYQFVVSRLEAEGAEGLWRLAFEKLRSRLEAEGLLDAARKRPLPRYPAVVGVVTSPTGAAFRDIVSVLGRRAPWVRVVLSGTRVQGEGAATEIARAINHLVETESPDVVIVSRGGGSVEDLWAFNEEPVARAIAACPVPVVSGVGHEVDVTIADLVADLRAPTPSAAAEAVVPDAAVLLAGLVRMPDRLARGLRGTVRRRRDAMSQVLFGLRRGLERRTGPMRQTVDRGGARLEREVRGILDRRRQSLAAVGGRLDALSPLATLGRGYSVARTEDGAVLRTVGDFTVGDRFLLRVSDGELSCETLDLKEGT